MDTTSGFTALAILLSALYFAKFAVTQVESAAVDATNPVPNPIIYRRFIKRLPAREPKDKYVDEILEIFHTKHRPPAVMMNPTSDDEVNNFIFCDFNSEVKRCQQNSRSRSHSGRVPWTDVTRRKSTSTLNVVYPGSPGEITTKKPLVTAVTTSSPKRSQTTTTVKTTTTTTTKLPPIDFPILEEDDDDVDVVADEYDANEDLDDDADNEVDIDQVTETTPTKPTATKSPFSFFG